MLEEKNGKNKNADTIIENLSDSIWRQTPVRDFGFKCVMSKHDLCTDLNCKCFCHPYNH